MNVSGADQGDERERTTSDVSKQNSDDVKTGIECLSRDQPKRDLLTAWVASGIQVA